MANLRVLEHSTLLRQIHIVPDAALPRRHCDGLEASLAPGVQLRFRRVLTAAAVHEHVVPPSAVFTFCVALLLSAGCCCRCRRCCSCLLFPSGLSGSPSALPGSLVALTEQHDALLAASEAEHHNDEQANDSIHEEQLGYCEQVQRLGAPGGKEGTVRLKRQVVDC